MLKKIDNAACLLIVSSLVLAGFVLAGCQGKRALTQYDTPAPPIDAYALSGGKITNFIPTPGLLDSSSDKDMLLACRQLPITAHTARSPALVITAGQFGRVPINALVVGKQVLVLPTDLVTMGLRSSGYSRGDSDRFIGPLA